MLHKLSAILFVNKTCHGKTACMFRYCFRICINGSNNFIECYVFVFRNQQQNLDASVVGDPFQMALHLFW